MRIEVARIQEGPVEYEVDLTPAFLQENLEDDLRVDEIAGSVTFRMARHEVLVSGTVAATLRAICARCLGEAAVPLESRVDLLFRKKRLRDEKRVVDLDLDEPDYSVYSGDFIEPDEELRDVLLLEIPGIILCDEECKGLCHACGANKNTDTCDCPEEGGEENEGGSWKDQLRGLKID